MFGEWCHLMYKGSLTESVLPLRFPNYKKRRWEGCECRFREAFENNEKLTTIIDNLVMRVRNAIFYYNIIVLNDYSKKSESRG